MKWSQVIATILCFGLLLSSSLSQKVKVAKVEVDERYDLKPLASYSFRAPFYLVRGTIPFWRFGGDTVVTDDFIRLTPAEKSRSGWIHSVKPFIHNQWVVEFSIKVGGGGSLGADGLAFWYVEAPSEGGPVFGASDVWRGLGIVFDTFDNDRQGNNPYIAVFQNDGSWSYEPGLDGASRELGGCRINYRNWDTRVKVSYVEGVLQVEMIVPSVSNDWTLCTAVPMSLPSNYFFAITAATGGLVDNHDVMGFSTYRAIRKGEEEEPVFVAGVKHIRESEPEPQEEQEEQPPSNNYNNNNNNDYNNNNYNNNNNNQKKGLNNRADTISSTLKRSVHEYEDTTSEKREAQRQEQPPAQNNNNNNYQPPADGDVVQTLLGEVQLLKSQQTSLQNSLSSLQSNINGFIANNKKNIEDLNKLLSSQQQLSENLDKLMMNTPSKEDVKNIGSQGPSSLETQMSQLLRLVGEVKSTVNDRLNANIESTIRQMDGLVKTVNDLRSKVDATRSSQSQIEQSIRSNTQEMSQTIERSTSWGFWTFFILFQVVFGVAFMWWKKWRDDNHKKLF